MRSSMKAKPPATPLWTTISLFIDNNILPDTNGSSKFTIRAIGHGIDDMLSDFLKPYPTTDKK